jgi:tetratricopeptide (TPR) repeat protein
MLTTVNNLGNLYVNQGKLVEAEQMYQRALQGYEKELEPEHTSTLNTVNNLGVLYALRAYYSDLTSYYSIAYNVGPPATGDSVRIHTVSG